MKRGLVAWRRKPVAFVKHAPRNDCKSWKEFTYKEIRDLENKNLKNGQGNWDRLAWK